MRWHLLMPRRRRWVQAVLPELRDPVLYLPQTLHNRFALRVARRRGAWPSAMQAGAEVEEVDARGLRVLLYRPSPASPGPAGALVWLHGGGLVLGSADYDHEWCSGVAAELGIVVVSVDYRLAPEHPFPAAIDDGFATLRWLHDSVARLGVDPERVAVGGSSAGGGLAAALAQRAYDEGLPVAFQLLRYPMLDDRAGRGAVRGARGRLGWTWRNNVFGWGCYLGRSRGAAELPAYAAAARRADLAGLAPAWIGVGDLDLFHDEDVDYARRLEGAGVPCELLVVPGMYHGADGVRPEASTAQAFRAAQVQALDRAVGARD